MRRFSQVFCAKWIPALIAGMALASLTHAQPTFPVNGIARGTSTLVTLDNEMVYNKYQI